MRFWTVHVRDGAAPELVAERFSLLAMLFGPLWLIVHRAWIPAVLVLCLQLLCGTLAPEPVAPVLGLGIAWLVGLSGQDMRRWALARRRYHLVHVVAARDEEGALARLFTGYPDFAAGELPAPRV